MEADVYTHEEAGESTGSRFVLESDYDELYNKYDELKDSLEEIKDLIRDLWHKV